MVQVPINHAHSTKGEKDQGLMWEILALVIPLRNSGDDMDLLYQPGIAIPTTVSQVLQSMGQYYTSVNQV